jgi:predicted nucleic acid-binding protein
VSVYLDASVLVALFTNDPLTVCADTFLRANPLVLIVSDFAAAEFSSVIARHVRTKDITKKDARMVFAVKLFQEFAIRNGAAASRASASLFHTFVRLGEW